MRKVGSRGVAREGDRAPRLRGVGAIAVVRRAGEQGCGCAQCEHCGRRLSGSAAHRPPEPNRLPCAASSQLAPAPRPGPIAHTRRSFSAPESRVAHLVLPVSSRASCFLTKPII